MDHILKYVRVCVREGFATARKIRRVIQASVGRVTAKTFLRIKKRARPAHVRLRAMHTARVYVHTFAFTVARRSPARCFHATAALPGFLCLSRLSLLLFTPLRNPTLSPPHALFVLYSPFLPCSFLHRREERTWETYAARSLFAFYHSTTNVRHDSQFLYAIAFTWKYTTDDKIFREVPAVAEWLHIFL